VYPTSVTTRARVSLPKSGSLSLIFTVEAGLDRGVHEVSTLIALGLKKHVKCKGLRSKRIFAPGSLDRDLASGRRIMLTGSSITVPRNIQRTFREQSEHPGNIQGTFRQQRGNIQGKFGASKENSGNIRRTCTAHTKNIQGTFGASKEHSRNIRSC
jgi:hypothetical protein